MVRKLWLSGSKGTRNFLSIANKCKHLHAEFFRVQLHLWKCRFVFLINKYSNFFVFLCMEDF